MIDASFVSKDPNEGCIRRQLLNHTYNFKASATFPIAWLEPFSGASDWNGIVRSLPGRYFLKLGG